MASAVSKRRTSSTGRVTREAVSSVSKMKIAGSKTSSSIRKATVKFGPVTLTGDRVSVKEAQEKVTQGQKALAKGAYALTKPGIRLSPAKDVPLFYADPKDPKRIVRVLNGKSEVGRFVGSIFKPL